MKPVQDGLFSRSPGRRWPAPAGAAAGEETVSSSAGRGVAAGLAQAALAGGLTLALVQAAGGHAALADTTAPATLPCVRTLRAFDAAGRPVFQTVAVALGIGDRAALPLHPLERGGARWERLEIAGADAPPATVVRLVGVDVEANLAIVEVPGLAACDAGSGAPAPVAGSTIRVVRDRVGYRPAMIGGHVERVIALPGGGSVALLRLLDDGGADPGFVFDAQGRFLGGTLPSPPASRPTLVAYSVWGGPGGATPPATPQPDLRAALAPREAPSAAATTPGIVAQALLAAGPGAAERGIDLLDEVVRRDGECASLLVERGVLQFNTGHLAPAIADFGRAVALDPAMHVARFNLGIALGTSGRYADAAIALRAARDLNPAHTRTRYQLAVALKAAHRVDEARQECDSLQTIDPTMAGDLRATLGL